MKLLQIAMDERQKVLVNAGANQNILTADRNATNTSGTIGPLPNLGASVKPPWERATTPANVPYYIEYVSTTLLSTYGITNNYLVQFPSVTNVKPPIGIIPK